LEERMERFYILLKNIYNFDKKDFLIDILRKCKRIVALAQLLMKQLIDASQNGSREFITFIAIICADESRISSALIYKSESGAIQDIWFNDFDKEKEIAYFIFTQKGWSNENAGLY
jgi:hypothetical protein